MIVKKIRFIIYIFILTLLSFFLISCNRINDISNDNNSTDFFEIKEEDKETYRNSVELGKEVTISSFEAMRCIKNEFFNLATWVNGSANLDECETLFSPVCFDIIDTYYVICSQYSLDCIVIDIEERMRITKADCYYGPYMFYDSAYPYYISNEKISDIQEIDEMASNEYIFKVNVLTNPENVLTNQKYKFNVYYYEGVRKDCVVDNNINPNKKLVFIENSVINYYNFNNEVIHYGFPHGYDMIDDDILVADSEEFTDEYRTTFIDLKERLYGTIYDYSAYSRSYFPLYNELSSITTNSFYYYNYSTEQFEVKLNYGLIKLNDLVNLIKTLQEVINKNNHIITDQEVEEMNTILSRQKELIKDKKILKLIYDNDVSLLNLHIDKEKSYYVVEEILTDSIINDEGRIELVRRSVYYKYSLEDTIIKRGYYKECYAVITGTLNFDIKTGEKIDKEITIATKYNLDFNSPYCPLNEYDDLIIISSKNINDELFCPLPFGVIEEDNVYFLVIKASYQSYSIGYPNIWTRISYYFLYWNVNNLNMTDTGQITLKYDLSDWNISYCRPNRVFEYKYLTLSYSDFVNELKKIQNEPFKDNYQ